MLPIFRTRLSLALVACALLALQLSLMRGLAIRLSSHFAGLVISVGLLGFGAAGSFLTLFRPLIQRHPRGILCMLALLLAVAIPATWWLSQLVDLNVNYLMWNLASEAPRVLLIELLMLIPFALGGAFIGVVLMDEPRRINGHYAADLLGSGIGCIAAVLAMNLVSTAEILIGTAAAAVLAALLLLQRRSLVQWIVSGTLASAALLLILLMPWVPAPNPYKPLTISLKFPGTQEVFQTEGPLGRIDVIQGPMLHSAPQLSLQYFEELPPHVELYVDGDGPTLIYDRAKPEPWAFVDYRTAALPYFLLGSLPAPSGATAPAPSGTPVAPPRVCIINAGGGVEIATALRHGSRDITAFQMNPQMIRAMRGELARFGGSIYDEPGVRILNQAPRGFFDSAGPDERFDLIDFPPTGGFGAAGSDATQESYAYTTQSIALMFDHLRPGGILALTRGINTPPTQELRAFDLAAQTLRLKGLDPAAHLAMIRGNFSCTILVHRDAITPAQIDALRRFCKRMSFDVCYFPGLTEKEANPFREQLSRQPGSPATRPAAPRYGNLIVVDHPYYFTGPQALLGTPDQREAFLRDYPFDLRAPTDNQPYFFHMFKWSAYDALHDKYGQNARSYLEVSYIMLLVSVAQAIFLAVLLILLPLTPGIRAITQVRGKFVTFSYFLMLGLGFMLLEMGFLQKLVLYLSHPIYAAAVVIASFLVFAGLGSHFSSRWPLPRVRVVTLAAGATVVIALVFLLGLDRWLALTQALSVPLRCVVAALTVAPLAFAMGHLFPMGLQRTAAVNPGLVPWAWAVNGFASVLAAASTPLLAMWLGFSWVIIASVLCYAAAIWFYRRMPGDGSRA